MNTIKLNNTHLGQIRHLFYSNKFMGTDNTNVHVQDGFNEVTEMHLNTFAAAYLSDSTNYHVYGVLNDNQQINSILGFYESVDDSSWYWTHVRTTGNNGSEIKLLLDAVIEYNEKNGRFKFYSMFPLQYRKVYRRLAFSDNAKERYGYFDEYQVETKHYPIFSLVWQILYNRTLAPVDTMVRCTFLKQQYRDDLYIAGRL